MRQAVIFLSLVERINPQFDIGVLCLQGLNLWCEPQRRDAGGTAKGYGLVITAGEELVGYAVEPFQCFVDCIEIGLTATGKG